MCCVSTTVLWKLKVINITLVTYVIAEKVQTKVYNAKQKRIDIWKFSGDLKEPNTFLSFSKV